MDATRPIPVVSPPGPADLDFLVTKRLLIFLILAFCLAFGSVFAIGMAEHEYDIDLEWVRYLIVAAITAWFTYYATRSLTPSE